MHTVSERKKLVARLRRIRGQLAAVERAVVEDEGCAVTMQTLAAARGALNGLVAELLDGHVRHHVLEGARASAKQRAAADELMDLVRAYVK